MPNEIANNLIVTLSKKSELEEIKIIKLAEQKDSIVEGVHSNIYLTTSVSLSNGRNTVHTKSYLSDAQGILSDNPNDHTDLKSVKIENTEDLKKHLDYIFQGVVDKVSVFVNGLKKPIREFKKLAGEDGLHGENLANAKSYVLGTFDKETAAIRKPKNYKNSGLGVGNIISHVDAVTKSNEANKWKAGGRGRGDNTTES